MTFEKEFLRRAFHEGWIDLGAVDRLEGFCRIFAGEMEATIAIENASWLSRDEVRRLLLLAEPTPESVSHHRAWAGRV